MKYTKEYLINSIYNFIEVVGRTPQSKDCKLYPDLLPSKNTFCRLAGSFNTLLKELGIKPLQEYKHNYQELSCEYCGILFTQKSPDARFCCVSCANKSRPYQKLCLECCGPNNRHSDFCSGVCRITHEMKNTTIAEMSVYEGANRYRGIRDKAHSFYRLTYKEECCVNCGYSKHVELAHIKSISEFSVDSTVWECNKPDNVTFLCPNCHWELDYGDLTIEEIFQSRNSRRELLPP